MDRERSRQPQDPGQAAEAPARAEGPAEGPPVEPTTQPAGELGALRAERDDLLGRLQRVSAEFLNYQKRARREMDEAREYANAELIKSLLVVVDDLERAIAAALASNPDDPLLAGTQLVHDKAMDILGRHGLSRIETVGRPFDPARHSALMQEPSAEHPPNTVLRELQAGYQLKGRTIRPAAVAVSKAPEEQPDEEDDEMDVDG